MSAFLTFSPFSRGFAAADPTQPFRVGAYKKLEPYQKTIEYFMSNGLFEMPAAKAAKKLGIGLTSLKRLRKQYVCGGARRTLPLARSPQQSSNASLSLAGSASTAGPTAS